MPSVRRMILGHVMSGMCAKINRKKKLEGDVMETPLKRCLSTFEITLLGIGHMIGAGIYVLIGPVTRDLAGPGVVLSFLLAGLASLLAALCYAEFGAKVPKAGSAYVYAYVSLGEFWAFVIGWNVILEHMIGAASVARAWSGYVDSLSGHYLSSLSQSLSQALGLQADPTLDGSLDVVDGEDGSSLNDRLIGSPDPVAALLCMLYALLLGMGVKCSTAVNSCLTLVNLGVMGLVIGLGLYHADFANWDYEGTGFLPYGVSGVIAGAATCFYAFVGFDSIATAGEEARDPGRSIPWATGLSMTIVTIGYVLVSGSLSLVEPYAKISRDAALPEAFAAKGTHWAKYVISVGALCGMTTTLLGSLFSLPRTMYAMASDGLLFGCFARVNKRTQVPTLNLAVSGVLSGLIALLFDLDHLVEFMSIGTFLAYTIVSASVIVLRYRPPPAPSHAMDETASSNTTTTLASPTTTNSARLSPTGQNNTTADLAMDPDSHEPGMYASVESQLIQGFCTDGIGRVKPRHDWLANLLVDCEPGSVVTACIVFYSMACVSLCSLLVCLSQGSRTVTWWDVAMLVNFLLILIASLLVISAHQQNPPSLGSTFRVPMVPLVPALSILMNIGLMFHLSLLTWLRFLVWMLIGLLIYFLYGIHYSKEAVDPSTYAVLMESSEAERGAKWGSCNFRSRKSDATPIVSNDELMH